MASSSEYVDRLGKASRPVKGAILGGVLLLLGGLYYYLIYSDMSSDYDTASAAKGRLLEDERRLIKRQSDYQELVKEKKEVDERLQKNAIKLPEASEVPAVFQHLDSQAATANVRVLSRTVEKEIPVETYIKVPVHMEVAGTFWQINQYFKLLSETKRIITIENLNISGGQRVGDHLELTAKFTASTFRQADKAAPAAAPPPQGPTDAPPPPAPGGPSAPPPVPGQPTSAPATSPAGTKIVENPAGAPPSAPPLAPPAPSLAPASVPVPPPAPGAPGGGK